MKYLADENLEKPIVDWLRNQGQEKAEEKPSLFGSISGGNITDETIQDSKSRLFRDIEDIQYHRVDVK